MAHPEAPGAEAHVSQARPAGILRLARLFDPVTLDAAKVELMEDYLLLPLLHQTLLDVVDGTNLVVSAATEWSASADKRVYSFRLRPGVRFSNGREVVAEDYVYALERALDPATVAPMSSYLKGIRGAEAFVGGRSPHLAGASAPTKDLLRVELEHPDPTFGFVVSMPLMAAVPREEVIRLGPRFSVTPVTTGAYQVGEWRRGHRLRLVPNPHYSGLEPRHFDGVDIMIGGDETTHLMMYERGELDMANITGSGIPLASLRRLQNDPRWRDLIEYRETFNTEFLTLNTEIPPLTHVLVRRAINHAINRDRWMRVATRHATHARGPLPPIMPGADPALEGYDYNPDAARRLLIQSGLPLPLKTTLWHALDEPTRFLAQGVKGDLSGVGIEVELKPVTFAQLVAAVQVRGQVPMATMGWTVSVPDPVDMLGTQLDGRTLSNNPTLNVAFYHNPEVDRILDLAAPEVNPATRSLLYGQAERLVVMDAPWVFLGHRNIYGLRSRRVKGPLMDPLTWYRFDHVWVEE
jgi:ABC-type transport system substrate-binding protein